MINIDNFFTKNPGYSAEASSLKLKLPARYDHDPIRIFLYHTASSPKQQVGYVEKQIEFKEQKDGVNIYIIHHVNMHPLRSNPTETHTTEVAEHELESHLSETIVSTMNSLVRLFEL